MTNLKILGESIDKAIDDNNSQTLSTFLNDNNKDSLQDLINKSTNNQEKAVLYYYKGNIYQHYFYSRQKFLRILQQIDMVQVITISIRGVQIALKRKYQYLKKMYWIRLEKFLNPYHYQNLW